MFSNIKWVSVKIEKKNKHKNQTVTENKRCMFGFKVAWMKFIMQTELTKTTTSSYFTLQTELRDNKHTQG